MKSPSILYSAFFYIPPSRHLTNLDAAIMLSGRLFEFALHGHYLSMRLKPSIVWYARLSGIATNSEMTRPKQSS